MGYGDEIMVTALARRAQERDPRPVLVVGRHDKPRWSDVWRGNPRILHPDERVVSRSRERRRGGYQVLRNGPGAREYVDTTDRSRWIFRVVDPEPGELYLTDEELAAAPEGDYIALAPGLKNGASANKAWPWDHWHELTERLKARVELPLVQISPSGQGVLSHVQHVSTPTFRHACGVIAGARVLVTHEGGLHHAAAALGVPAVVLFGGYITPRATGYAGHVNLADEGPLSPCGLRQRCAHCEAAMQAITPEWVCAEVVGLLERQDEAA